MEQSKLELVSHWNYFIDGLSFSSTTFYQYLKGVIKSRELTGVRIDMTQFAEHSVFSGRRKYLRIRRGKLTHYVCAAPFGQGFFISSWLMEKHPFFKRMLMKIPFFGKGLVQLFYPATFYKIDSTSMYLTVIQDAVVKTTNHIAEEGGQRPIPEMQQRPQVRDIFSR